ncbi:MAG: hypothetical protein ACR65U_14445 [Methylocystis sp.]
MFRVTNRAPGARGFHTKDRGTVFLEPGETAVLDLAPLGPVEKAWKRAREIAIEELVNADEETGTDTDKGKTSEQGAPTDGGKPETQTGGGDSPGGGSARAPNPPKLKGSGQ